MKIVCYSPAFPRQSHHQVEVLIETDPWCDERSAVVFCDLAGSFPVLEGRTSRACCGLRFRVGEYRVQGFQRLRHVGRGCGLTVVSI